MPRFWPAAPLVLSLGLALGACSGDDATPDASPSSPTSGSPGSSTTASPTSSLPPAPPADALETAMAGLRDARTGEWRLTVSGAQGGWVIRETGVYQVDPPASLALRAAAGAKPRNLTTISDRTDLWFRGGQGTDLTGCWAHRRLDPQSPTSELVPPSVQILFTPAQQTGSTATTIDATVPLRTAAEPFGEVMQLMLNLESGYGNVPVTFTVEDGALTGYRVALDDVLAVGEEAGVEPVPGLADLHLVAELTLLEIGEPVTLGPPAPDEVVELKPRESVAHGLDRCGRI